MDVVQFRGARFDQYHLTRLFTGPRLNVPGPVSYVFLSAYAIYESMSSIY